MAELVIPASTASPVSTALADLVRRGSLSSDPLQSGAALVLDRIAAGLALPRGFFSRRKPIRGAYLVGAVGRGKTMLMDLFFSAVPIAEKRRIHFHEFMDEMHEGIAAFRASPRGQAESADPVAAVARPVVASTRLLCLDEFQVSDITNAMLLGRLFEKLFAGGVTLVATSNTPPGQLYENGLNRDLFVPFIALLEANAEIVPLDGPTDYRRLKFEGEQVYRFGTGPKVDAEMDRLWAHITGGAPAHRETVRSLGRDIVVPAAAMGAARFSFAELCEAPLGARDYLRLAHAYDALMIDNVPLFSRLRSDAAKRFILLVDTLYDRGVKLSASFAVPLDALAQDDRTKAEFARCISRLIEMQSAGYLAASHSRGEPSQGSLDTPGGRG
ncbi:MAG TPA: cell division protein ZapE [Devosia sp.]|nr:cell division protein ZapE [Devosia sp.]